MAENEWLSVSEVSEKVGIPVETIRRYLRSHGVHLKVKKVHKRYVVHDESVTVISQIRELYAEGKNVEEVEQTLSNRGIPMTVTVQSDSDDLVTVNVADELKRLNEKLEEQMKFNQEQREFNRRLVEKLEQQQSYIDEKLDKRDQHLIESLKAGLKERQEQQAALIEAAVAEQQKKRGFFARLFGK